MSDTESPEKVLKPSKGDAAISVSKGILSFLPGGGAGTEIVSLIITPPMQKRMQKWMDSIGNRIAELEVKIDGFSAKALTENEVFVTTVLQATQVAMRTHQEAKLEALRNAVTNSALPSALDDTQRQIFLNIIDTATPFHFQLLKYLDSPVYAFMAAGKQMPNFSAGARFSLLTALHPQLYAQRPLVDIVVRDLHDWGLIDIETLHGMITESGMRNPSTTQLGKDFLKFISPPPAE
jgi:hypothetical protein